MYNFFNMFKEMNDIKLLLLHGNTWNHLTVSKKIISGSLKNVINIMCLQTIYLINIYINKKFRAIGLMSRVFANDPGEWGSISARIIPKTQKMVLDATLLNTQYYKVSIKGKVEQSR